MAIVTLMALVVACGDDDGGNTSTPTASPSPTLDSSPAPTEPAAEGSPTPTVEPVDTEATIEVTEFSIDPLRTSARPGSIIFHVENLGELMHEFLVIRTDLPHAELPRREGEAKPGADESQLDIVGRTDPIEPGDEGEVTVELSTGNYVLICNFVTDGVSHYLSGMYDRFTISETAPAPDTETQ